MTLFHIPLAERPECGLRGEITREEWGAVSFRGFLVAGGKQLGEPSGPPPHLPTRFRAARERFVCHLQTRCDEPP